MPYRKQDITEVAKVLRIMGDPTRLRLLLELQKEECNVSRLCERLDDAPQPSVSRHLAVLRMGGLVRNRREGKLIHYSLADIDEVAGGKAVRKLLDSIGNNGK